MMQITDEEYVILRGFFHETSDYRINHDMKKADNLENYICMYEEYLKVYNLSDNKVMKKFLLDLKRSLLRAKKRKKSIEDSVYEMSMPLAKTYRRCGNDTIDKWVALVSVIRVISPADIAIINAKLKPKLEENALIRVRSFEEARDKIVR